MRPRSYCGCDVLIKKLEYCLIKKSNKLNNVLLHLSFGGNCCGGGRGRSRVKFYFWPCGHAATVWPKTAAAAKFLRWNSHFQLKALFFKIRHLFQILNLKQINFLFVNSDIGKYFDSLASEFNKAFQSKLVCLIICNSCKFVVKQHKI